MTNKYFIRAKCYKLPVIVLLYRQQTL